MSFFGFLKRSFSPPHPAQTPKYDLPVSMENIKTVFSDCSDFQSRTIAVGGDKAGLVSVCYIDGLVDGSAVSRDVIRPLTESSRLSGDSGAAACLDQISKGAVYSGSASEKTNMDDLIECLVKGFCLIVFDRLGRAAAFETRSGVQRSISEPTVEKSVKGAKDSFIERLRVNTMLVRRKLRTPDLKMRRCIVGRQSDTELAIVYIDGISDPVSVGELERRLNNIDIDGLLATGNLEEYLSDNNSPFPQIMHTERPDRFAINLLDGRIGLLIDGLPLGMLVPGTLAEMMRVPEDRAQHFSVASFLRVLRYIAAVITVMLPALYVAMAMYHQEMIPLKLLSAIVSSKQGVPFGTAVEVIGMLFAFELLQEAGLRLPNPVGETVSIIGALIVGQSAVEAKVISPIAVIVVAIAGITGYTLPNQDLGAALRLCRFFMVFCALLGGMYGVMIGLVLIIYHLCSMESFGLSYLSPLTDGGPLGIFFMLLRLPLKRDKFRSQGMNTPNVRNQK